MSRPQITTDAKVTRMGTRIEGEAMRVGGGAVTVVEGEATRIVDVGGG